MHFFNDQTFLGLERL